MGEISKHVTLKEVTKSNTATRKGIDNTPTPEHLENLKVVAEKIFEPLRKRYGVPIGISSGYRSYALNKAVKGSSSSHHCRGMALDIDADIFGEITNKQIFDYIRENLEFTQLIWEFGTDDEPNWVHAAYEPGNLKKEVLKAYKVGKKTKYKSM